MSMITENDRAVSGHNSIAGDQVLAFIERIEKIEERISEEQEARKEVYSEAKGVGFDPAIIREIVKIRKQDADKRRERDEILTLYLSAIGMEG